MFDCPSSLCKNRFYWQAGDSLHTIQTLFPLIVVELEASSGKLPSSAILKVRMGRSEKKGKMTVT